MRERETGKERTLMAAQSDAELTQLHAEITLQRRGPVVDHAGHLVIYQVNCAGRWIEQDEGIIHYYEVHFQSGSLRFEVVFRKSKYIIDLRPNAWYQQRPDTGSCYPIRRLVVTPRA